MSSTNADDGITLRFTQDATRGTGSATIVALRFAVRGQRPLRSDELIAFDERGNVLWTVQPDMALRCGAKVFNGPWRIYSVHASTGPGPLRLWVALNDPTWWPGVLTEIDTAGHTRLLMVSAGWIRDVVEWQTRKGHLLAVSGVNNERDLPSLSLIDLDAAPTMSPHSDARFSCESAPASSPRRVYLFPPLDTGAQNHVTAWALTVLATGLKVQIFNNEASAYAELDGDLNLRSLTLPEDYWAVHRDLETQGVIHHAADSCPERTRPQPIEEWTPESGWVSETILPTASPEAARKSRH